MLRWRKLHNHDLILLIFILLLSVFGLLAVFTTTFTPEQPIPKDFVQQVIFFVLGYAAYMIVSVVDISFLKQRNILVIIFGVTIGLLVAVYFTSATGPKRWLQLGDFSLQPSEFAKLTLILITAAIWSGVGINQSVYKAKIASTLDRLFTVWRTRPVLQATVITALAAIIIIGLIWRQPSLGNALITTSIWLLLLSTLLPKPLSIYLYGVVFVAGINLVISLQTILAPALVGVEKQIAVSVFIFLVAVALMRRSKQQLILITVIFLLGTIIGMSTEFAWNHLLTGYQRDRITAFAEPESDPLGSQWQVNQSKRAIASGLLGGKGILQGTQSRADLLPYDYTDFIYAAFVEQLGARGSLILLGLIYLICLRCILLAQRSPDTFSKLICIGIGIMLAMNTIVNVGMNQGVMPVTGVPLPLVSYGGSAVLVNLLGLGLVQLVSSEEQQLNATKLSLTNRHTSLTTSLRS